MEPLDEGQRVEFVPWDHLRTTNRVLQPSRQLLFGGVIVVCLLLVGLAWLRLGRPVPIDPVAAESEVPLVVAPETIPTTTAVVPVGFTEADLRAVVPGEAAGRTTAVAAEFLRAYLSDDDPSIHRFGVGSPSLYVEWLVVVSTVEEPGSNLSTVTMRVGLLELGDEPRRLPVREYSVLVAEGPSHKTVSIPIRRDVATDARFVVENRSLEEVPAEVLAAAMVDTDDEVLGGWMRGASWYVLVRDRHGTAVSVEVSPP